MKERARKPRPQWFDPKREYRYNIVEENKKGEKTWHI